MKRIQILHTDPDFWVIQKPGGLLAVPGRGIDKQECAVKQIREQYPDCIEQPAVHRLDMATSGIMLLARTASSHRILSIQFAERLVRKEYLALLDGKISAKRGSIELAFRLDPSNRPYQIFDPLRGKLGISHWKNIGELEGGSLILFSPQTGRTHQLRLHAAHPEGLGTPIRGDFLYGTGADGDPMFLHASRLSFLHPRSAERIEFTSRHQWYPPDTLP